MYWQQPQQQVQPQMSNYGAQGGWNMPGANSIGTTSWNNSGPAASGPSVVAQFDSATSWNQQQQQAYRTNPVSSSQERVGLYTRYYHEWKRIADTPSVDKSQQQWATYYADLATRAAHYFHQNPNVAEPPHDMTLPPAPPTPAGAASSTTATTTTATTPNTQQGTAVAMDPKSFKAYLDRCLQQCTTPREKEAIAERSKEVLKRAIQSGSLHTKDWSQEPILLSSATPSRSPDPCRSPSASSSSGYYGHSGSPLSSKKKKNSKKSKNLEKKRPLIDMSAATSNDSYYGPSASSSSLSVTGSSSSTNKRAKSDGKGFNISSDTLNKRKQRFHSSFLRQQTPSFDAEEQSAKGPIVIGTCQVLEKEYLRLTSAPKPELVRPQEILEKHFANLKSEYANEKYRRDYLWLCSQLKAIRQDATIQHLKNVFCVDVYEFHAKVAIDNGDLNEFNQCQTQLKYLYPSLKEQGEYLPNRPEFLSYRILYAVCMNLHSEKATIDMNDIFGNDEMHLFLGHDRHNNGDGRKIVKHAMSVLTAAREGNYHAFFTLFPSKFGHQNYFLELMAPSIRKRAVESMCGAYRPVLDVDFVVKTLKLPPGQEGTEWVEEVGCVLETITDSSDDGQSQERLVINTKESVIKLPENPKEKSKLM